VEFVREVSRLLFGSALLRHGPHEQPYLFIKSLATAETVILDSIEDFALSLDDGNDWGPIKLPAAVMPCRGRGLMRFRPGWEALLHCAARRISGRASAEEQKPVTVDAQAGQYQRCDWITIVAGLGA